MTRALAISVFVLAVSSWTLCANPPAPVDNQAQTTTPAANLQTNFSSNVTAIPSNATLDDLRRAGNASWRQGDIVKAFNCYQTILAETDHSSVPGQLLPGDLYAMGNLSIELGQLQAAEKYYQRSLEMFQHLGLKAGAGQVYLAMGGLYEVQGAYPAAEIALRKGVDLLVHSVGPSDVRTGKAWTALSWHYSVLGRLDEAAEVMQKADAASKNLTNSPELIDYLDSQAALLGHMGRYAEAQRAWNRAIETADRLVGKDRPEYDFPILHLAQADSAIGDYESAEKLFERFLSIERRAVPQGSLSQALGIGELGNVYVHLREYEKAEPLFLESVHLLDTLPNKAPLVYAEVLGYFGDYWMTQNQWSNAEQQYHRALELREPVLGKSPLVAQTMSSLSLALEKLKRKDEAKTFKMQAQEIIAAQPKTFNDTVDVSALRAK